jgi:nicotinate-nucleotide adenylyltransferase
MGWPPVFGARAGFVQRNFNRVVSGRVGLYDARHEAERHAARMGRAMRRRKVGILGGTFNPVHIGHLLIAQDALEQAGLDVVKFIPCARPPHKRAGRLAPAQDRLEMLRLAVAGDARFEVDDIETRRGGVSYSVETLEELTRRAPGDVFYFIIGSDSLAELHRWRDIRAVARLCRFVVLTRPGGTRAAPTQSAARRLRPLGVRMLAARGHLCDVSSRELRKRIASGRPIRYFVPDAVAGYIEGQQLYR